ncbi:membrane protein [Alkalihalobacillus alcalophilus ATCC 27647 = CGMCC 1.3604]|uniref:Membrane protein n=1 Tax=Alkalihalobacillus alcalophilus ATCC 27647 = CGMCC 1.3604 TaxID=1218173 RepID=A0A4S4K3G2_ALKAL|nr:cytochrome c biogenesis protein CcdC [Alkalihalobacillus alcalophilus]MED1562810.1 cytochrome c biogenesis protein CcdC [Alkalihalobacillus alcalophilus]THG91507.1 membrane protein [Alkalihalobacillus alcalophilus ATCC 27647 = CGMCC 1.3604]
MESFYLIITSVGAVCMAILAIFVRLKSQKKPASIKKIVLPPLFMSSGFLMFLYEPTYLSILQVLEAVAVGLLFSILLIKSSKFEIKQNEIYMKRSKLFAFILVGLLAFRIVLRIVLGQSIEMEQIAGMFFILAYSMIIPWRVSMYFSFRKIEKERDEAIDELNIPVQS